MTKSTTSDGKKTSEKQQAALKRAAEKRRAALKKYRHELSILKKKGIIAPEINVRKAVPTRSLKDKIKKFADVISGNAKVWKVDHKDYARLIKSGEKGARDHIVLSKDERFIKGQVIVKPLKVGVPDIEGGKIVFKPKKYKGVAFENLEDYLDREINYPTLKPGEAYSFTFFGNRARYASRNPKDLIKMMMEYPDVVAAVEQRDIASERALIKNFQIVKIDPKTWLESQIGRQPPKQRWRPAGIPLSEQAKNMGRIDATGRTKNNKTTVKQKEYRRKKAEKRREKMTDEQLSEYRAKNREAMRRSRAVKKDQK